MTRNHAENGRILTGIGLILGAAGLMLVFAAVVSSTPRARATHVDPEFVDGNPDCDDLGFDEAEYDELKADPPSAGLHTNGTLSVTLTLHDTDDGPTVDFTSNIPVQAVFVKGGSNGNLYDYGAGGETSDTGLHAPLNPSGKWAGLSHLSFCYDPDISTPTNTPENTPTNTTTPNTPTNTPPTNTPVATSTQRINVIPTSVPTSTTVSQVLASTSVPTVAPTRAAEVLPTRLAATGNGPGSDGHNALMLGTGFAALISGAGLLLLVRRRATER
jgi:hypothetical protein